MADDGLVNMSNQFAGLPMRDLIGGPLQAACDAQNMLAAGSIIDISGCFFSYARTYVRTS